LVETEILTFFNKTIHI